MKSLTNLSLVVPLGALLLASNSLAQWDRAPIHLTFRNTGDFTFFMPVYPQERQELTFRGYAGRTVSFEMKSPNPRTRFELIAPGSPETLMLHGTTGSKTETRCLPDDGNYRIRIFHAAGPRADKPFSQTELTMKTSGFAMTPVPVADDLLFVTRFHIRTTVECSLPWAPKEKSCPANVLKRIGGAVTIELLPAGRRRLLLASEGKIIGSDSEAPVTHERKGDIHVVTFGSGDAYQIPNSCFSS